MALRRKALNARKSVRKCKRNCTRFQKGSRKLRRGTHHVKGSRKQRSGTRHVKGSRKQRGGNSATLRDPAKYNDLVDVIYDPEERDGFSAPVLVSRDVHDEMFDLEESMV